MRNAQRLAVAIGVVAMAATPIACSGDSDDDAGKGSTTTTTCPFDGTTGPVSSPGGASQTVSVLQSVDTKASGCIDTMRWNFTPATPAASVHYDAGPFTDTAGQPITIEGAALVVEFTGATTGSAGQPQAYSGPSTVAPNGLGHITRASLQTTTSGNMAWVLDIDEQRPYAVSSSADPAYFILSIG